MGVAILGEQYLWPNRIIPYVVDPAFRARDRLDEAIAHWHALTSIRFVPRRSEPDYLLVAREPGAAQCDIGRRRGEQKLLLGDGCTVGSIKHELGHAVGLCHEHCRSDRDQWVTIDMDNVRDGREGDFRINFICGAIAPTRNLGDYDYASLMHYGEFTCARETDLPVITPLRPIPPGVMGQRDGLSAGDIAAVELLYAGVPRPPVRR